MYVCIYIYIYIYLCNASADADALASATAFALPRAHARDSGLGFVPESESGLSPGHEPGLGPLSGLRPGQSKRNERAPTLMGDQPKNWRATTQEMAGFSGETHAETRSRVTECGSLRINGRPSRELADGLSTLASSGSSLRQRRGMGSGGAFCAGGKQRDCSVNADARGAGGWGNT